MKVDWRAVTNSAQKRTKAAIKSALKNKLTGWESEYGEKWTLSDLLSAGADQEGVRCLLYQVCMGGDETKPNPPAGAAYGRTFKIKVLSAAACWERDADGYWHILPDGPVSPGMLVRWKVDQITENDDGSPILGVQRNEMVNRGEDIYRYVEFKVGQDHTIDVDFSVGWEMLKHRGRKFAPHPNKIPRANEKDAHGEPARKIINHLFDEVRPGAVPVGAQMATGTEGRARR